MKASIARALRRMGYAWAEVEGQVQVNRDRHTVLVALGIKPGPEAVFGRIEVRGAGRVDPRDIARHAAIRPGARFTQKSLEIAQGRLYDLGMFASVQVDVAVQDPSRPGTADVIITVSEGRFHEVRLGVGLGLEFLCIEVCARVVYI